jgi:hypothetical protein
VFSIQAAYFLRIGRRPIAKKAERMFDGAESHANIARPAPKKLLLIPPTFDLARMLLLGIIFIIADANQ